jgi:hypothetical protein
MDISYPGLSSVRVNKKSSSVVKLRKLYPGSFQHVLRHGVCVALLVYDVANASIDEHLGTNGTGQVRTVNCGFVDRDAMVRGLNDDILFRMKASTEFVSLTGRDPKFLT